MTISTNIDPRRIWTIKEGPLAPGPVVYWMSRDQRVHDNWALLYAQEMAFRTKSPLGVVFCLAPRFLGATIRQYGFMLDGLEKTERELRKYNIPLLVLMGKPDGEIPRFIKEYEISALVTDFSPLRIHRQWKSATAGQVKIPFYKVDAHNIVSCWTASQKCEYGAYTIRPKIHRLLPEFLTDFPRMRKHPVPWAESISKPDWAKARALLRVDTGVREIDWLTPGEKAAHEVLHKFLDTHLEEYGRTSNDPTAGSQSNLSPYIHFGHISAQRVAFEVQRHNRDIVSQEAFLEQLIVRRELSDNFCYYNSDYDSPAGFPEWARTTLDNHRRDIRPFRYNLRQFEEARTHDDLWNAAQQEMVVIGKMHGYMRMYWAKKILEWTASPEEALETAIYLNDKYELDGRDPNGYVGIAWSIGGVHDRAWSERDIFGKIRYMSYDGCRRKFDVQKYVDYVKGLETAKGE